MSSSARQLYLDACTRAVQEAKQTLTLAQVWDLAPHAANEPPPANGFGVVRSPLREDRPPGNFSVFEHGKAFDDKARAGVKGGVWEFVAFSNPALKSSEIARVLVERAGLSWPDWKAFSEQAAKTEASEDDKAKAKRLREERLARERAEQARVDQAERERRADRDGRNLRPEPIAPWPACVAERWEEGAAHRDAAPALLAKLCEKRGWPVAWADMLAGLDVLAFPVEAWAEIGAKGAKRMVAFRVEAPRLSRGGATLETVGYHQKFYNLQTQESGWRFLPSAKRPDKRPPERWSSFEHAVFAAADERGVEPGKSMIPPLPFVAGCVTAPRLVIILEGQWDALTFMGALGGLHPDVEGPRDVAFFGIRGVNGTRAFIDYWGPWIQTVRPLVWLLPDNDGKKTGGQWYPPPRVSERLPGVTYFSERLLRLGARRVKVTQLRETAGGGKDFNDYYKSARPDAAAMWRWMEKLQLA